MVDEPHPGLDNNDLIAWSGGCDSTYLLIRLLKDLKNHHNIRTLSINHSNINHSEHQKRARKRLKKILVKYGAWVLGDEINIKWDKNITPFSSGIIQPLIWLPTLVLCAKPNSKVYLGYVKGDDIWHYRTELFHLFDVCCRFMGKSCELKLPLEWITKTEIIRELKKEEVYQYCWYCECPKEGKPCRNCSPCKRHRTVLRELKVNQKSDTSDISIIL